jgi:hypothetical protein
VRSTQLGVEVRHAEAYALAPQSGDRMKNPVLTDVEVPLTRVFVDGNGVEWEVLEVEGADVPAARGERCLIFRSPGAVRRVWNYPRTWTALSASELVNLSWNR